MSLWYVAWTVEDAMQIMFLNSSFISHICFVWRGTSNWKRSSWSFGCSRPYPTWHQSMPRILWGITTPGSCQWWGVLHAVFDNDSDMAWHMPCWININAYRTTIQASSITWLAEPQPTSNWCVSFLIQNDMTLEVSECFEAWLERSMVDHRVCTFLLSKDFQSMKRCEKWWSCSASNPHFFSSHFWQESPSVEVSFTGADEGGTFLSWRFYLSKNSLYQIATSSTSLHLNKTRHFIISVFSSVNQLCFFLFMFSWLFFSDIYQLQSQLTAFNLEALVMSWLQWASQRSVVKIGFISLKKDLLVARQAVGKYHIPIYPHLSQNKVSRHIMPDLSQVSCFFLWKKWSDKVWYLEDRAAKGAAWRETEIWAKQDQTKCLQVFCEGNLEKILLFPNLTWTLLTDFLHTHCP